MKARELLRILRRTGQMKIYTVRYERDETGWWVASIPSVKGCHTQATSIQQARKRIREALGLFISHASDVELIDDIRAGSA